MLNAQGIPMAVMPQAGIPMPMMPPMNQFPPEAQKLLQEAHARGERMDDDDIDDNSTRRRGRPRGSKTLNAYIQNDAERRKYFVKRIKAIRSQAETFARCTGGNILVVAVQGESGGLHHCGTGPFERFVRDERVAELMYSYLNENSPATEQAQEEEPQYEPESAESPEEILVSLIMARLETNGLCVASQVCRAWRARCYMPDLWHARFELENSPGHAQAVEAAFARVGVSSHLDWRALHRDRCIAEHMAPGCHLFHKFLGRVPGFDSLRIMVLSLLNEPTERIDTIRWTIVEHMAQFGMNDMWDEADQMMTDSFADQVHGFTAFLPLNDATFTRLEQYACMYHNWHVYDFLLTKAHHLVPPFRTSALLVRARMVFQDAYIPQTWVNLPDGAPAAAIMPNTGVHGTNENAVGAAVGGIVGHPQQIPVIMGPGGVPMMMPQMQAGAMPQMQGGSAMQGGSVMQANIPLQGVIAGAMSAMEQLGGQGVGEATVLPKGDGEAAKEPTSAKSS